MALHAVEFASSPLDILSTTRGWVGHFAVRASPESSIRSRLQLFGVDGQAIWTHDEPLDDCSGRISAPSQASPNRLFVSETLESTDDALPFARVRVRELSLIDGTCRDFSIIPESAAALPRRNAMVEAGGRLWCLAVNADFMLTLYGLAPQGAPIVTPIAPRIVANAGAAIVSMNSGFVVVSNAAKGESNQIEIRFFSDNGELQRTETTAFASQANLGAVRAVKTPTLRSRDSKAFSQR